MLDEVGLVNDAAPCAVAVLTGGNGSALCGRVVRAREAVNQELVD